MGLFNANNIERRAARLMSFHIGRLEALGKPFERDGEAYYQYVPGSKDYLRIGYTKTKKFLSRTFNLEIKYVLNDIAFDDSFKIKLRFQGFKEINGARFVPDRGSKGYEAFFNDPGFLETLWRKAKEVELAYVVVEYFKSQNKLEIRICPYAGAFLWVVVPPVFYDMKLRDNELVALMDIAGLAAGYVDRAAA
jgi:hypothetical protein